MFHSDVLIVGAGPSGLAAAVTLASEGRSVRVLEAKGISGGQAGTTWAIENYLSHTLISGSDFASAACGQCAKFGVDIRYNAPVRVIFEQDGQFIVYTGGDDMTMYSGSALIIATGLSPRPLGVPGDDLLGVIYGMDTCFLAHPGEAHVALIGGGNSAGQAATFYLNEGASVTLYVRRTLHSTMSAYLIPRIMEECNIIVGQVSQITKNGTMLDVQTDRFVDSYDCVHVFTGMEPVTYWLPDNVQRDPLGYVITDRKHRTSARGIFAVGDVESHSTKRAMCAVGYGNEVVPEVHAYLNSLGVTNYRLPTVKRGA